MQVIQARGAAGADELRDKYLQVRADTVRLCEPLEVEDYIPQPVADVSPPKWNIAHTTWFFEEMILKQFVPGYEVFDQDFGFLFNSYYNSIGDRTGRSQRGTITRPTVAHVFKYREHVDARMSELLARDISPDLADLVTLGINHEQQHQELFLTDLKFTFSLNPLLPVYRAEEPPEEILAVGNKNFIAVDEGIYEIGHAGDGFCFDNELARHKVYLEGFEISDSLVTNAEFIEFINAGGYSEPRYWHSDGWDWVRGENITAPLYWGQAEGVWHQFTFAGLRRVLAEAPVCHISFYEAAAFVEWLGMRLPTEFEWEAASNKFNWGTRWEWTNSAYLPYPRFSKAPGAVGEYNGKFMINQMVLRGASAVTPAGHSRSTYRNFFHPNLRWQFIGLRLAR